MMLELFFFFYWLTKYRCKLWLRPENMGFNYAMPALRYLVLVVSPTFCGCAAPVYDKTPTAMCKPQQRASWRGAKLSYIALQFTLMKWPQQKADLSSPFFFPSLLGRSQNSRHWHLFVVIFTARQSETSNPREGLQLYLGPGRHVFMVLPLACHFKNENESQIFKTWELPGRCERQERKKKRLHDHW